MSIQDMPKTIQNYLMTKMNRDEKEYRDNRISVTDLCGCLRKAYFKRREPAPITLEQAFTFNRGILFDEEYTSLFPRNQVRVTHRISNYPIVITGRLDFIDEDGAVADWKTIDGTYWIEQKGAKEENITQVLFYAYCEGLDKARLYYMSLGNLIKVDVDADDKTQLENMEKLEDRALELYENLCCNSPPERDDVHTKKYWECEYKKSGNTVRCEYYDKCYGDKNE